MKLVIFLTLVAMFSFQLSTFVESEKEKAFNAGLLQGLLRSK